MASVMYPTHKAYTRDNILPQKADVSASELADSLGMPLGEALVILGELTKIRNERSAVCNLDKSIIILKT